MGALWVLSSHYLLRLVVRSLFASLAILIKGFLSCVSYVERWHRKPCTLHARARLCQRHASTGQPAPAVGYWSRVPPWGAWPTSLCSPPRLVSLQAYSLGHRAAPKLIMPLHLGGTSLKPFWGLPSFLLVSATADSLDSRAGPAAEPRLSVLPGRAKDLGRSAPSAGAKVPGPGRYWTAARPQ